MSGLTLYTYDRKNWDAIAEKIQLKNIKILTAQEMNIILNSRLFSITTCH